MRILIATLFTASLHAATITVTGSATCSSTATANVQQFGTLSLNSSSFSFYGAGQANISLQAPGSCTVTAASATSQDRYVISGATGTGYLLGISSSFGYSDFWSGLVPPAPPYLVMNDTCTSLLSGDLYCPFTFGVPFTLGISSSGFSLSYASGPLTTYALWESRNTIRIRQGNDYLTDLTISTVHNPEPATTGLALITLTMMILIYRQQRAK